MTALVKVEVLGCSGGVCDGFSSTCLRIGDRVLLDAGTGAQKLSCPDALKINDIVVSHSHLDHVSSICFLTDHDIEKRRETTRIHCMKQTKQALMTQLINGKLWPQIEKVSIDGVRMLKFSLLSPYRSFEVRGCKLTPLSVDHSVPTVGFALHGKTRDMIFISDMCGASERTWNFIEKLKNLRYFVAGAAFPNRLRHIAQISGHMTPEKFAEQCQRVPAGVRLYATHLKPRYYDEIVAELRKLEINGSKVEALKDGDKFDL